MWIRTSHLLGLVISSSVFWTGPGARTLAADQPAGAVLYLADGGFVAGELRPSQDSKVVSWHSSHFTQPLAFPLSAVTAVQYAATGAQPKAVGEYCIELAHGDVIYANLVGLTETAVELDCARFGRIHLSREAIQSMARWKGADTIYSGPGGLTGWKQSAATPRSAAAANNPAARRVNALRARANRQAELVAAVNRWRDEAGQLVTDAPEATVSVNFGMPDKAAIEAEISWKRKPNFIFDLGLESPPFRFEVWDQDLVAVAESSTSADAAPLQKVDSGEGRLRLRAYVNFPQGRLTLLDKDGASLATLKMPPDLPILPSGVRLTNIMGDVRLEYLRVVRWNGELPGDTRRNPARVRMADGSTVPGEAIAFDPKTRQLTLRQGQKETSVKQEAVSEIYFPLPTTPKTPAGASDRAWLIAFRDASRISGVLTRVEEKQLRLACPGVQEELRIRLEDVRSIVSLAPRGERKSASAAGRLGRLELEGVSLSGWMEQGDDHPDASCLVWRPEQALRGAALVHGVTGRIIYRERPVVKAPAPTPRPRVAPAQPGILDQLFGGPARNDPPVQDIAGRPRSLYLRNGDSFPCEITSIDEKGVRFKTPISNATFVAHDRVKSVKLIPTGDSPKIDETKRERLLTLPRLQKDSPPTQLVCSRSGDFLRGRVVDMDDKTLKIEVRLETREVPRDRIAQIIWFQAEELAERKTGASAPEPPRKTRVQAVHDDGNRLTFVAERADGKKIWGTSEVLGACQATLADVDQLLLGDVIEQSAARLAYGLWKLHHAAEPKFTQAEASASADGHMTGLESPLVGKPAPPVDLEMLDSRMFHLAEHRGRIVVLDFFATWCGPCMQTMPLVDAVLREFADRNITFAAVNLEERPDQIKPVLERHKLPVPVALDRDGVVAAKYGVTAIPQTVVIDREGKVARLFVGGGKATAEALRKALQELSAAKGAPAAKQDSPPDKKPAPKQGGDKKTDGSR